MGNENLTIEDLVHLLVERGRLRPACYSRISPKIEA